MRIVDDEDLTPAERKRAAEVEEWEVNYHDGTLTDELIDVDKFLDHDLDAWNNTLPYNGNYRDQLKRYQELFAANEVQKKYDLGSPRMTMRVYEEAQTVMEMLWQLWKDGIIDEPQTED